MKDIIIDIRKKNNITQEQFANKLFVTRQAVSRWELGESIPNVETIKMISELFGVPTDTLLNVKRNMMCQCCTYPLHKIEELGTNEDGTLNTDYCIYCYKGGKWVDPNYTIEDVVNYTIPFMTSPTFTAEQAREYLEKLVPTLKRWKEE